MLAVAAVVLAAAGVIMLAWPRATLVVVAVLAGVALIVTGLVRLFDGFTARHDTGARRVADVLIGVLAIIAGLFCVRHNELSVTLVAFVVGAFWVLHGLTELAVAATSGPLPGRGLRAVSGLLSLAAGLAVVFWPSITVLLLVQILGIWLILYAATLGALAFWLHRRPASGAAA
jgi:uncharacterized membrane protein HdeD (DUF308 family)